MPEQESTRVSRPKESQQPAREIKPKHREHPIDAALCVPETKRQRRPLVDEGDATSFGARSSTTVVINPEEDSGGLRRVGPLVDAASGKKQAGNEDLRTSNRESVLEDPVGTDDLSDVSGTAELTAEQELLRAVGLDVQSENWFGRD